MKYIEHGEFHMPTLELTRRNLLALLVKLDDAQSMRTIIDPDHRIAVKAVEDVAHYADRPPGRMHPDTEGRLTLNVQDPT